MKRFRLMFLSIVSVVLVATLIGGATFALFTANTSNANNTFTAGTVKISNANKTTWSANFDNMAPGDTVTKTITITNTGSLELEFAGRIESRTGDLFQGANKATVALTNGYGTLASGAEQDVTVSVTLPLAAGEEYEGDTGNLTLVFYAWQTKNLVDKNGQAVLINRNDAVYDKVEFKTDLGVQIHLGALNLVGVYMIYPDGTSNHSRIVGDTDPYMWFDSSRPAGTYTFVVVMADGTRYTINHIHTAR